MTAGMNAILTGHRTEPFTGRRSIAAFVGRKLGPEVLYAKILRRSPAREIIANESEGTCGHEAETMRSGVFLTSRNNATLSYGLDAVACTAAPSGKTANDRDD